MKSPPRASVLCQSSAKLGASASHCTTSPFPSPIHPSSTIHHPPSPDVLRAAWHILSRLESGAPMRHPSVTLVVRLYCIEKLTIPQVARRCRPTLHSFSAGGCSVGTIADRLARFEAATGLSAALFAKSATL